MAGTTHTNLEPGDRCIIYVNEVNSPRGWWWGIVDSIEWNDDHKGGWGKVEAHITGEFRFHREKVPMGSTSPLYGDDDLKPSVNYTVYKADRDTISLVDRLLKTKRSLGNEIRDLKVRLEELRYVVKTMGLTPDTIIAAVREAVAKTP